MIKTHEVPNLLGPVKKTSLKILAEKLTEITKTKISRETAGRGMVQ